MRIGLYPGTFDPITLGHTDILRRAAILVDRLVVGVAINRDKGPLFSLDERVAMVEAEGRAIAEATVAAGSTVTMAWSGFEFRICDTSIVSSQGRRPSVKG